MGPLYNNSFIGENANFLLAFLIGIAFGFVLESSGFSSSRKLAGVFYGYDTVVLKVFFTGAITAAVGLLFFSLFGWIDLSLVWLNPTYLLSAILGGVIMGLGFIMGGFCPGTSFCAASIGKKDAMVFIVGLFIGVFIFMEGYPKWEKIFMAKHTEDVNIKLSTVLGLSDGVFTLIMIIAAVIMFRIGEWTEKKFPQPEY